MEQILQLRKQAGLTREKLAQMAGVNAQTVYRVERGESERMSSIIKIAEALGYRVEIVLKPAEVN